MYSYIKGYIVAVNNNHIVIENNQIGYEVFVANPYYYNINESYKVYIYQYVREDMNILFGFESKEWKDLFLKLISVSGIGPKTALGILANGDLNEIISAIENCDHKLLTKFPGIGPKASSQIILDLKGKLTIESNSYTSNLNLQKKSDLEETLKALGYKDKDIKKVLPELDLNLDLNQLVKDALKNLLK